MADKSFGIKELNLIGASGTPTITSPNNLNLNASNVAISTDVTVGRHLDVDGHAEFDNVKITGVTTFSGDIKFSGTYGDNGALWDESEGALIFKDGRQIRLGDYDGSGGDLRIYHAANGSHSYIQDTGTGNLRIISNGDAIELLKDTTENMAKFNTDGSVELYYDNSKKFETAGSGINVVGTTTTGQLSVSGVSTFLSAINVSSSYGTSGQVLTSQGSGAAPQWASVGAQEVASATLYSPAVSSITVTGIPTTARNIRIAFANVSCTDGTTPQLSLFMGNGSLATSNYYWVTGDNGTTQEGTADSSIRLTHTGFASNAYVYLGTIDISRAGDWMAVSWSYGVTGATETVCGGAIWAGGDTIDRIKFQSNAGNFDNGKISVHAW